ncbi:MAG: NUDIX hydrolase [Dysgonomonas sp.]|uniref:NUDIX hydrolase n=1 Tax=Dysgonomonas TaxID=156973 RepID=UPI00333ECF32
MNEKEKIIADQVINGPQYYYRNVSVDNVIFGYHERELKVLLQRPQNIEKWMLPGGYIKRTETAEESAYDIVRNRTKLENLTLYLFKVFSKPDRVKDESFNREKFQAIQGFDIPDDHWMFENFISIGYFALTEYTLVKPTGDYYAEECCWWDINNLPSLLYDHEQMIKEALIYLKFQAYLQPIGYDLLPEKFTIPEIHSLYETILDKQIDIRNFTKKLTNMGLIIKLKEQRNIGAHRSPFLYKFDKERYDSIIKEGIVIVF